MNRLNRALYLLPIVLIAIGCGRADGHETRRGAAAATATITRTWPASSIRELRVFEIDGSIKVDAAATDQITLVATASGDLEIKKGEENDGLFETRLEGDTLRIGRREERKKGLKLDIPFLFGREEKRVDYVLKVPPTVTLEVMTVNGRIVTRGVEGETQATTVNGRIDIETAGLHELRATSVNGAVKAKFTRDFQGARFKTVNGGVEAFFPQNASFAVDLSQVNGDFEAAFPLSIHSNPGSRRVSGEVNGGRHDLKIVTVNGDVELAKLNGT
jgi:Putative adhesin